MVRQAHHQRIPEDFKSRFGRTRWWFDRLTTNGFQRISKAGSAEPADGSTGSPPTDSRGFQKPVRQNPLMVRQAHHQWIPEDFKSRFGRTRWWFDRLTTNGFQRIAKAGSTEPAGGSTGLTTNGF